MQVMTNLLDALRPMTPERMHQRELAKARESLLDAQRRLDWELCMIDYYTRTIRRLEAKE